MLVIHLLIIHSGQSIFLSDFSKMHTSHLMADSFLHHRSCLDGRNAFENGLANMTLHLRVKLNFHLATCSVVLADRASHFCPGMSWFWKLASAACIFSLFFFFFITFKILGEKRSSSYNFYALFLRQTRSWFLDTIPCRWAMNNSDITNGRQSFLCIPSCR